jgi:NifU-like protein
MGGLDDAVNGASASLVCGAYATLSVRVEPKSGSIDTASFRTNGCGFMIAAADVLCDWLANKSLAELHGLNDHELLGVVSGELGEFSSHRSHCATTVFEALRAAMSAYRAKRIEEFQGEKALICTCFGVSEETVVSAIDESDLTEVDEVSDLCRAGSGCGSCRFLIQALIDSRNLP